MSKRVLSGAAAMVVLALAAGACADDVKTPVSPDVAPPSEAAQQSFTDLGGAVFWNACTGEYVGFDAGSVRHTVTQVVDDGAGGYHIRFIRNGQHYNGPGLEWTGSGWVETGTRYVGNGVTTRSINAKPPFPGEYTYTSNTRVMQKGSGANMLFHEVDHITVNANGEVTADVLDGWFECL